MLASGPVAAKDVVKTARANGISERTLKRAKSYLGVQSQRTGGLGTDGQWRWWLPNRATPSIKETVAPLEEVLSKPIKSINSANPYIDDDPPRPTSLRLDGSAEAFSFNPTTAFAALEPNHNDDDCDEF